MELIHAGGLAQFDEMRLLRLAENAKLLVAFVLFF